MCQISFRPFIHGSPGLEKEIDAHVIYICMHTFPCATGKTYTILIINKFDFNFAIILVFHSSCVLFKKQIRQFRAEATARSFLPLRVQWGSISCGGRLVIESNNNDNQVQPGIIISIPQNISTGFFY